GAAVAEGARLVTAATRVAAAVAASGTLACGALLYLVHDVPAPGDISSALKQNPELYTLSLGHMADLTLRSFAYLKLPLAVAAVAFFAGAIGAWKWRGERPGLALAAMMVLFVHAARLAMVKFDPYLSSRPLAEALRRAPPGELVVSDQYYAFSSVFFYANRRGWLWDGRVNNLEYGSLAPDAPDVFLDDARFAQLWNAPGRCYVVVARGWLPRLETIAGPKRLHLVAFAGGKYLFSNHAIDH
ncbi:MAG: glycosyltransferase family 39 protein, partial [Bryobacteraceae bacterium]